ncbi:MAG: hypothetical protein M1836_001254 [Candelina mexicana]|nr:MAG: hypothetical protein M1836_001254 [Candelina mexicana]
MSNHSSTHGLSVAELEDLSKKTIEAKDTAYCPYSKFRVGACILTADGKFITGANIENASYPVGMCAERAAFAKAVTEGHREFKALGVATDVEPAASPCGMCRQFIREFCALEMPVLMHDRHGKYVIMTLEQLLPMSFGPDALPPPEKLVQQ